MALAQKQQDWATIIENWLSSGLTQADYCQRNNIKLKEFSNWKYRLDKKKKQTRSEAGDFLPVTVKEPIDTRNNPVTVVVADVTIQYCHDTDPALFIGLVNLLREAI